MAETYKELESLSKDELIKRHDKGINYVQVGIAHYLAELRHRDLYDGIRSLAGDVSQGTDRIASIDRSLGIIAAYILARWDVDHKTGLITEPPPSMNES